MSDEAGSDGRTDSRDRLYASYVTTHLRGRQAHRQRFPVLAGLPDDRAVEVLDIGCGSGELVAAMRSSGYTAVRGIDVSAEQVALARSLGRGGIEQADVHRYLASSPSAFDVVTATDVLEHFAPDEVVDLLDGVLATLRPGGTFLAQVPNATSPFFGNYAYGDFTHRSVYTERSVQQICANAGFGEVRAHPVAPVPHGVLSMLRSLVWAAFSGVLKLALAAETGRVRGHIVTQNLWLRAVKPGRADRPRG